MAPAEITRTDLAVPVVDVARLLRAPEATVIDLRSPSEFAEDHLLGAINLPLFDDVERALIGTLYKQRSPQAAFTAARRITRERVGDLVAGIARAAGWSVAETDLAQRVERLTEGGIAQLERELEARPITGELRPDAVVLHCWRGGLRSRAVVTFLRGLGLERCFGLEGGYKRWRAHVRHALEAWVAPPAYVLRGFTGVGKTLVLRELERQRPGWTVDLEGHAGHRSSILGMVGLEPCSQKAFETRLAERIRAGFPAGLCVFEGESRKVGDAILPARVWDALAGGVNLHLTAPPAHRVEVLVDDYLGREENRDELRRQLPFIEQRLGPRKYDGVLVAMLDAGREAELTELLLERYYDPLYAHSERGRDYAAAFDTTDPVACATALAAWIEADHARRVDGVDPVAPNVGAETE